jgi:flagellar biosynthesis anti-sigma factor FlgM
MPQEYVMKIYSDQRLPSVLLNTNNGTAPATTKKTRSQGGDRVDVSSSKGEVAKLKSMMSQGTDSNVDKIPKIRQMIDDGTYHVAAADIAVKMLDRWKDFTSQ